MSLSKAPVLAVWTPTLHRCRCWFKCDYTDSCCPWICLPSLASKHQWVKIVKIFCLMSNGQSVGATLEPDYLAGSQFLGWLRTSPWNSLAKKTGNRATSTALDGTSCWYDGGYVPRPCDRAAGPMTKVNNEDSICHVCTSSAMAPPTAPTSSTAPTPNTHLAVLFQLW